MDLWGEWVNVELPPISWDDASDIAMQRESFQPPDLPPPEIWIGKAGILFLHVGLKKRIGP
jgi:hypothetical protein